MEAQGPKGRKAQRDSKVLGSCYMLILPGTQYVYTYTRINIVLVQISGDQVPSEPDETKED